MKRLLTIIALVLCFISNAQNDVDALRYSRPGIGGSSRYVAMGGAFGALGADLSCAGVNPAGLGLFKKGELLFGAGLRFTHNNGNINGKGTTTPSAYYAFNSFGMSLAWNSSTDDKSRHVFAFTSNQLQNFGNKTRMQSYTNNSSIVKDMLNIAQNVKNPEDLNYGYEGAAFNTFVLDTFEGKYISFVDLKRSVLQTRDINTTGKMNELNFSYAFSYHDKFYLGASIGVPKISYTSTTTHVEADDKDSMKVIGSGTTSSGYTSTYIDNNPPIGAFYLDKLGFNNLTYTEYFTTSGSGFNLKLGAIARLNDYVRVGLFYHTPTVLVLRDTYYSNMKAVFDKSPSTPLTYKYPEEGGYFNYNTITPSRLGISTGFIIKKIAAIGVDYELVNYKAMQLSSSNIGDFAGVNAVIKNKYSHGSNIRLGGEVNIKPVMLRAGYIMQGSPFGDVFVGSFVRHTISLGLGLRTKNNMFVDFSWYKNLSSEDYYPFTTLNNKATITYNNSMLSATIGVKF